jgi:hypothetical protein
MIKCAYLVLYVWEPLSEGINTSLGFLSSLGSDNVPSIHAQPQVIIYHQLHIKEGEAYKRELEWS